MNKKISEYDVALLHEARQRLMSVCSYYFGDTQNIKFVNRLDTIIGKLDEVIKIAEKMNNETRNLC